MLDADQKKACETDKNSVVSAGAGAGKTGVLASRYVRLITEGKAGVENILTLTFTNKAASEMWARIYSMLLTEKENPQAEAAIRQFDRARISTIDSFCASVARNWAERFGIPRDFVQDNAASGERLKSLSLSFMLEHGENPALKEFIRINKFENVLENFFVSLGNEYIHIAKETDFDAVIDLQLKKLQEIGTARASELDERTARILALDGGFKALEEAKASLKPLPGALELFRAGRYEELTSRYEKVQPGKRTGAGSSEEIQLYKEYADEWITLKDDLLN
ncbi:MAG TPA: UvrD-helicase domain-containing protein, partial [Spirochaetia bacterium]|nr:UvrD-helicase domain-containing protein [Spirochaetia bacterium]